MTIMDVCGLVSLVGFAIAAYIYRSLCLAMERELKYTENAKAGLVERLKDERRKLVFLQQTRLVELKERVRR